MLRRIFLSALMGALLGACGDDGPKVTCADFDSAHCVQVPAGDVQALIEAVNSIGDDTTVILAKGTYEMDRQVTIRNANKVNFVGQGIDVTILDFAPSRGEVQINGIDVIGDDFLVQDLTVANAVKDGIRVESSDGVTFRRIKATWSGGASSENGAYGIYPVKSQNVLVEDSIAEYTADAGLYVGQCINVIVRRNHVHSNVAGLEIENTQYADVYENTAENNTAGIVVFDLPGNPVVGRDVRIRENIIRDNNHVNFAPGGVVAEIPPGTGTFALASRRVEIVNNTYENNHTGNIAILSGLVIEPEASWRLVKSEVIGDIDDLDLPTVIEEDVEYVYNYKSEEILISGNAITSEQKVKANAQELGVLLFVLYGSQPHSDHVIYDGVGETVDASNPGESTNENHVCVAQDSLGVLGVGITGSGGIDPPFSLGSVARFSSGDSFSPYDCTALTAGPVVVPDEL